MHPELDEFLEQLEEMIGYEGTVYPLADEGEPPLWLVVYEEVPDEGSIAAFTFGLSLLDGEGDPTGQGRELTLTVESENEDWGFALGVLARSLRGKCPFEPGNVIRFGEQIDKRSELTAFVCTPPTFLDDEQVQLSWKGHGLSFVQLVPLYEDELPLLEQLGLEGFLDDEDLDIYDIKRPRRQATEPSEAPPQ